MLEESTMKPANHTLTRSEETIVFLVYPQDVNYKYARLLSTVQPGVAVGPHRHPNLTETFRLITDVTATLVINGKVHHLTPHDPIATTILPNEVHEWVNDTDKPLTFEVNFYPVGDHSLQEIDVINAFTSYFALTNESQQNPDLVHKLTTAIRFAVLEYTFRNYCVSVSLVARVKVFLLAMAGQVLGLKP
jgi:quercetin dioxygenase-like cupin family protein